MNIYVGNLPRTISEEELRKAFEAHGEVSSVAVIKDKFSGEPRGFGFVEMPNDANGQAAIDALNGQNLGGRNLTVNIARPKTGGGGRGGGGGGRRW
jgi:RNA recognition motif-containing protein